MGLFDTVHTPTRCGQVKCFGKRLADVRIGDLVVLHRLLDSAEYWALSGEVERDHDVVVKGPGDGSEGLAALQAWSDDPRTARLMSGDPQEAQDYQVLMYDGGGFLQVRGGRVDGWRDEAAEVPCVDGYGRAFDLDGGGMPSASYFLPGPGGLCRICREK